MHKPVNLLNVLLKSLTSDYVGTQNGSQRLEVSLQLAAYW